MNRNMRHFAIIGVLVIIGALVMDKLLIAVLPLPTPSSAQAEGVDFLFRLHMGLISFFFSLIVVFVIYSIVVFRARKGDEGDGEYIHGHTTLEIVWTVVPLIIVIYLGFLGTKVLGEVTQAQPDEKVIQVTGFQWGWRFEYPEEGITSTTLVLPKDQPIRLEMQSEDVIHSFFIPEFRVKQDLVPGHVTTLRITPTKEGGFVLRCAELCGTRHAYMLADVQVLERADYDAWVAEQTAQAELPPAELGAKIAQTQGCQGCHSLDGSPSAGPTWKGLFGREETLADGSTVVVDEEYLRESILHPQAKVVEGFQPIMPTNYGEKLSNEEINAIIEFIKTLQ